MNRDFSLHWACAAFAVAVFVAVLLFLDKANVEAERNEAFYQLELLGQEPCSGVIKLYDIMRETPRLIQTQEYRFPPTPVQPLGGVR